MLIDATSVSCCLCNLHIAHIALIYRLIYMLTSHLLGVLTLLNSGPAKRLFHWLVMQELPGTCSSSYKNSFEFLQ